MDGQTEVVWKFFRLLLDREARYQTREDLYEGVAQIFEGCVVLVPFESRSR